MLPILAETPVPHPGMIAPFLLLLASIAICPLYCPIWWGRHFPKVAIGLGAITVGYYLIQLRAFHATQETALEYIKFIALIGSLYIVSGGIHIRVRGEGTPLANTTFLFVGAILANFLGTTGASMLLIRPWIRLNRYRITAHHIVFFIFVVANVGGALTPIGDPPLYLGYIRGVPFWWTLEHLWPLWIVALGILLTVFYVIDYQNYLRAPKAVRHTHTEGADWFGFDGGINVFFLAAILGAVLFAKSPPFLREGIMVAAALGSYFTTPRQVHAANNFNFHALQEVAILFIGIFATMMPALDWLKEPGNVAILGTPTPTLFYWSSGLLSSVLDNAPTYLCFFSASIGETVTPAKLGSLPLERILIAVSAGAVFFGANTYIGNGPNFMVKAIADQEGVTTPSFLGYVLRFALPVMGPMLALIWFIFLRN